MCTCQITWRLLTSDADKEHPTPLGFGARSRALWCIRCASSTKCKLQLGRRCSVLTLLQRADTAAVCWHCCSVLTLLQCADTAAVCWYCSVCWLCCSVLRLLSVLTLLQRADTAAVCCRMTLLQRADIAAVCWQCCSVLTLLSVQCGVYWNSQCQCIPKFIY